MNKLVTCNECGWVSFEVSHDYVLKWQQDWEKAWSVMNEEYKKQYNSYPNPPSTSIDLYLSCHRCNGSYRNFRDYNNKTDKDITGSTINPVMNRDWNKSGAI